MEKQNVNILIVDDNASIHEDIKKILSSISETNTEFDKLKGDLFGSKPTPKVNFTFSIDSAMNGAQALAMVENNYEKKKRYSLIFMDIMMPIGWDGIETAKRIWEVDFDTQIVICSAFSEYSWEDIVAKIGINDNCLILKKPFEKIEVAQIACCLTQKWLLSQQAGTQFDRLHHELRKRSEDMQEKLKYMDNI